MNQVTKPGFHGMPDTTTPKKSGVSKGWYRVRLLALIITPISLVLTFLAPAPPVAAQNNLNCSDFSTQAQAQAAYDKDPSDPNNLDSDKDGKACEGLSGGSEGGGGTTQADTTQQAPQPNPQQTKQGSNNSGGGGAVRSMPRSGGPPLIPIGIAFMAWGAVGLSLAKRSGGAR